MKLPPLLYGANSKANYLAIADLNADGLGDIVIANTRINPYYIGAALQIVIQTSPGVFEDQTSLRINNTQSDSSGGEGQLRIFDANGDGLIDIVHSLGSRGANVFLNDGLGHFNLFDLGTLPLVQQADIEGLGSAGAGQSPSEMYPIDIDSDGLSDFVSFVSLDNYATSTGNTAILYSIIGNEVTWRRDGAESLTGTQLADHIRGYGGNDTLYGGGGNDTLDGGEGVDTAIYSGNRSNFALTKVLTGFTVIDNTGNSGTDRLESIERIQFSDKKLALDLSPTQHGGQALEFIGLMAPALVKTPSVVGLILSLFDQGKSLFDVCQLALDVGLVNSTAGSSSNAALAAMAYKNLIGSNADASTVDMLVGYMDGRSANYSQADFMTFVAGLEVNQTHIGLVGLQQTGIGYV